MQYILTTSLGQIYSFSVFECAKIYRSAFGGTLITEEIKTTETV